MNNKDLILNIANEVRNKLEGESSGHDWWHVQRVWKMAKKIGEEENANLLIVELGALLHDIADWKLHNGDENIGPRVAEEILLKHQVSQEVINCITQIIRDMNFQGAGVNNQSLSLEGKIIQDADRLDAIGAIGIARAFAFGGHKNTVIYDPNVKPSSYTSKGEYTNRNTSSINHFYEKILLLKDLMNTKTGKEIVESRHKFTEEYLERFFKEWEGEI